jgi:murein DD-endopeptidase MepM/ murein hydrolase activator NlpD
MLLLLSIILLFSGSSHSLLEELAIKSTSLFPIMKVVDLYVQAGMIEDIPLVHPLREVRRISSPYGYRIDPFTRERKFHSGIDYACDLATTVHATANGIVIFVGIRGGYGRCIEVRHKYGFSTLYAHLSGYYITPGMSITVGRVIGFVGSTGRSTGNHLHYEVRKNNRVVKPLFFSSWDIRNGR